MRGFITKITTFFVDDDNRIVLKHLPERDGTNEEYINASYIDVSNVVSNVI